MFFCYLTYCLYSLYFLELPFTISFGYFFLFFSTLSSNAFERSTPHTSLNLTKYDITSANYSPKWVFSFYENSGTPLVTSPFHWNISLISPTSPTNAKSKFLGVWNWCHSLSSTNPLITSLTWCKVNESSFYTIFCSLVWDYCFYYGWFWVMFMFDW